MMYIYFFHHGSILILLVWEFHHTQGTRWNVQLGFISLFVSVQILLKKNFFRFEDKLQRLGVLTGLLWLVARGMFFGTKIGISLMELPPRMAAVHSAVNILADYLASIKMCKNESRRETTNFSSIQQQKKSVVLIWIFSHYTITIHCFPLHKG